MQKLFRSVLLSNLHKHRTFCNRLARIDDISSSPTNENEEINEKYAEIEPPDYIPLQYETNKQQRYHRQDQQRYPAANDAVNAAEEEDESTEVGKFRLAEQFTRHKLVRQTSQLSAYTLAPLVNKSRTLRSLVDLGVNLAALEDKKGVGDFLLRMDWQRDVVPRLQFLALHAQLTTKAQLADYVTQNPWILQQDMDHLQTRVNYLESKQFSKAAIARIITIARYWLNTNVETIDDRLGWLKKEFRLTPDELRFIVTKHPKLITFGKGHIQFLQFSFEEEMGFNRNETKQLMLKEPRLWTCYKEQIRQTFDYLHNTLKFSHEYILTFARVLRCHVTHVKSRHEFLNSRRMAQYDPERPNYISLYDLASGSDATFCENVAKCAVSEYNRFLKRR